jgi:threonyl-tRNA synthetase
MSNPEAKVPVGDEKHLYAMRHSLAHIMATAIQELHPEAKFGVGPVVEDGFYYDVDLEQTLSSDDLQQIEKKMAEVVKADYPFEHSTKKLDEAVKYFEDKKQPYKVELLKDLKQHGTTVAKEIDRDQLGVDPGKEVEEVGLYTDGPFTDLCRGPHVESTGKVGAFKLMRVSGAYWRGSEKNPQLQRVYGVGFATKEELKLYLERLEEAEKRDHRKLGRELDLYVSSEIVGAGLPLFTPAGTTIINAMMNYVRDINNRGGYQEVRTGHVTREELYEKSGHLEKFGDDLFVVEAGEDKLALKPMNCPHHIQLYADRLRSYRELPIKYAEFSTLHRNEVKGALGGLTRVRALTQDDAHAFVRPDQIEDEIRLVAGQVDELLRTYGLEYWVRVSLRDPENKQAYLGDDQIWDKAEQTLEEIVRHLELRFERAEGEAAFYGPKLDFMATDALGREWQVSTVQLDFNQPERFGLEYIAEDGSAQRPVMIHRALNGSFERMLGVLIEHYAGAFPAWLAYEPVRVVTVNDDPKVVARAHELCKQLRGFDINNGLDLTNESVGKKIREAGLAKVPYTIVVGEKEAQSDKVSPRLRQGHGEEPGEINVETFIDGLRREIAERRERSMF